MRALVRLDGFTEAPRQASRADCHGVAATVGFALELQEREQGGGSVRHNNGTSPELGLLILTMHRVSCQLTYLFSTSLRMLPCKLAVTVAHATQRREASALHAIVTLRWQDSIPLFCYIGHFGGESCLLVCHSLIISGSTAAASIQAQRTEITPSNSNRNPLSTLCKIALIMTLIPVVIELLKPLANC